MRAGWQGAGFRAWDSGSQTNGRCLVWWHRGPVSRLFALLAAWVLLVPASLLGADGSPKPPAKASPESGTRKAAEVTERDQLSQESDKLAGEANLIGGEFDATMATARKVLTLDLKSHDDTSPELIPVWTQIAEWSEATDNLKTAQQADESRGTIFGDASQNENGPLPSAPVAVILATRTLDRRTDERNLAAWDARVASLVKQAKFRDAIEPSTLALETRERLRGPEHPDTAINLNDLAFLYHAVGDYATAADLFQKALKIREKVLGPNHPGTATSICNLATLYNEDGNYAAAEPLFQRALKIFEKTPGPEHPKTATCLNNLAGLYLSQGRYVAAKPLLERSLNIREKVLGPIHLDTAQSINNLAFFYESQANHAAAEPLYKRALSICEKTLGPVHPYTATTLNNLASLYRVQQEYGAAESLYQRSIDIHEKTLGPVHPHTVTILSNLALLYHYQNNHAAARPLYERVLMVREKVLGADHPETAVALMNLGSLYCSQEGLAAANPLYQRALTICEESRGPNHPLTAACLSNLCSMHWNAEKATDAQIFMRRSAAISLLAMDRTSAIQTEQQQFLMADDVKFEIPQWLTVTTVDAPPASDAWALPLSWKGQITVRQRLLRQSLSKDPLFAEFQAATRRLSTHTLAPPLPPSDPKLIAAWKAQEPAKLAAWESRKTELETEHERLEKELAAKSADFRRDKERQSVTPAEITAALRSAPEPTALVDLYLYQYMGRKSLKEPNEARIAAFIARPDGTETRVELGASQPIQAAIRSWRESYGRASAETDPAQFLRERLWLPLAKELDGIETVLIAPDGELAQLPWGALPGTRKGTFLLEERGIAMLPSPQDLPELLRKERRSAPPASLLLVGDIDYGGDSGVPGDVRGKRDAVLRDGKKLQFGPLAAAQAELSSIKDWREQVGDEAQIKSLRRKQATESAIREAAPRYQWLHFVTHGYFAPDGFGIAPAADTSPIGMIGQDRPRPVGPNPGLLSGLAFTGANQPQDPAKDDGILTALEVSALPLDDVQMVVLSACETGLGQVAGGEGLLGLQRAFQLTGAQTTVATLWKIPDAATTRLMERFYSNLWKKRMGRLAALREAQTWMLREGQKVTVIENGKTRGLAIPEQPAVADTLPPYYWAAFVLSGDWR